MEWWRRTKRGCGCLSAVQSLDVHHRRFSQPTGRPLLFPQSKPVQAPLLAAGKWTAGPRHETIEVIEMESFTLAANHAGAINHHHTFNFNPSVIDAFKEVRIAVTVVVAGWIAVTGLRGYFSTTNSEQNT